MYKTPSIKKKEIERKWYLIDASGLILGRMATKAALILRGKHKTNFTPQMDNGDFLVIINASKIKISGKKIEQKEYIHHTGYPGGLRRESLKNVLRERPEEVVRRAIKRMIPNNRLKKGIVKRLKIYKNDKHKHSQKLTKVDI